MNLDGYAVGFFAQNKLKKTVEIFFDILIDDTEPFVRESESYFVGFFYEYPWYN